MSVVAELARGVHSFLHIRVLTAELLDLLFNGVLHEMLSRLALAHHGTLAADRVQLIVLMIERVGRYVL